MNRKPLRTPQEIVDALRGYQGAADFTRTGYTNPFSWIAKGKVPPKFYRDLRNAVGAHEDAFDWADCDFSVLERKP